MYKQILFCLVPCLLFVAAVQAQHPLHFSPVPIVRGGVNLPLATVGGLEAPQYSPVDLDNDGKDDLLVYDRAANVALTFRNVGTAGQIRYDFAPEYMERFPQGTPNFMLVRDYNCDGIGDLFHFFQDITGSGIRVLRGSYDANDKIQFTLVLNGLKYDDAQFTDQQLFIYNPDLPAIDDIDGDGDLDVMAFALDFSFARNVFFYKNMSQENGWGCDSLKFQLYNRCFGQFSESGANNTVIYSGATDSCGDNPYWRTPRHLGSTLAAFDHNGDGVQDLFMGDVSVNTLNMLTMQTMGDTLVVVAQDSLFPSYNTPTNILSYPAAYFIDLDGDGRKDMLTSTTELAYGEAVGDSTTWLYLNTGTGAAAQMSLHSRAFMYEDMVDLGREAHPSIVDWNRDGLLDLVVGNSYRTGNTRSISSTLTLFLNTGTATAPAFEQSLADVGALNSLGRACLYPTWGDMDGDGDMDLLVGLDNGTLAYCENIAPTGGAVQLAAPTLNYGGIAAFGNFVAPQLFDVDGDGDLDIVAGESSGNLNWFENKGSAQAAQFLSTPNSAQFGLVALNAAGSRRSMPYLYRNTSGDTEMLLGHDMGNLIQIGNIDGNLTGKFDTLDPNFGNIYTGRLAAPVVADFDGDTLPDVLVGNARGGFGFYLSASDTLISRIIDWSADLDNSTMVFPNPTVDFVNVRFLASSRLNTRINVYSVTGFLMQTNLFIGDERNYRIDLRRMKDGIYFLEILRDGRRYMHRIVVLPR